MLVTVCSAPFAPVDLNGAEKWSEEGGPMGHRKSDVDQSVNKIKSKHSNGDLGTER